MWTKKFLCLMAVYFCTTAEVDDRMNLEFWMTNLPSVLKKAPLIYLAIPGSHDSMSAGITESSTLAPDAPEYVRYLKTFFRSAIIRWTKTQNLDAYEQLSMGIRYFDLRVATKAKSDELFFSHALYAEEITKPLLQVKDFLDKHPQEVVILDFQKFYNLQISDYEKLAKLLMQLFGSKLCNGEYNKGNQTLDSVTLESLQNLGQQVIIVYRSDMGMTKNFWRSDLVSTSWPQRDTTQGVNEHLLRTIRPPGIAFVHQAVLSPTPGYIFLRFWSSIRDSCAKTILQDVLPVIETLMPSPGINETGSSVNIVIADHVDLDNAVFPRAVIELNYKLLKKFKKNE